MLIQPALEVTVWLLTAPVKKDGYDDDVLDWANATRTPLPRAEILIPATRSGARSSSTDDDNLGMSVEGGAILIMSGPAIPPMTDVNDFSRFADNAGRVWRVSGNANIKKGRHFQSSHLTVPLHFLRREGPGA